MQNISGQTRTQVRCGATHLCKQLTHLLAVVGTLLTFAVPAWSQTGAVTTLAIDPATPTTLYAGTSRGVFKSTDGGATWSATTLPASVSSLAIDPLTPTTIYTNAYKSADGGATWNKLAQPGPAATVLILDPNNPSTLYAGGGGFMVPTMFRSTDGGASWVDYTQGLTLGFPPHREYRTIQSLTIDPRTSTVYAGVSWPGSLAGIARRTTTGMWQSFGNFIGSEVLSIAIQPTDSQVIYATVHSRFTNFSGVLKSIDGGINWTYSNTGLPPSPDATSIAIDPVAASTLYVGLTSGIFKSIDSGTTWTTSSDGFASGATVNALVIDPVTPSIVYAATSLGLYKSSDHGAHWTAINQGLGSGSSTSAPVVASLSPDNAPQDSFADVSIAGTSFTSPFGLNFGRGISVVSATINTPTSMTVRIRVDGGNSVLGARDVTLTTAAGTSNGMTFTVTPGSQVAPRITSVSPPSVAQGATTTITLAGTGFTPSMSGTISGTDVTLSSILVSSPTSATAVISVGPTAAIGTRSLQVSSPFGGAGSGFAFDVTQGFPVISSMSPPFVLASQTTSVTFTGIRLVPPLTFVTDPDIRVGNVSTDPSFTAATVSITVPANATLGAHSLRIVSGGQQSVVQKFMVRSLSRHTDFNGDGKADLLWYNVATGETEMRLMDGINVMETGILLRDPNTKIAATGDFDGNGKADLIWYNRNTGETSIWLMDGTRATAKALLLTDGFWQVVDSNDFDGNGKTDLVWNNGIISAIVLMNGIQQTAYRELQRDANWQVVSTADFKEGIFQSAIHTGEGFADLLWKNTATSETVAWVLSSAVLWRSRSLATDPNWSVAALPDLDGDGKSDLIWNNAATGQTSAWILGETDAPIDAPLLTDPDWKVRLAADLNGDHKADLIWFNPRTGQTVGWLMDATSRVESALLLTDPDWEVTATGDFNGDGKADLLWTNDIVRYAFVWIMDGLTPSSYAYLSLDANWRLVNPGQ